MNPNQLVSKIDTYLQIANREDYSKFYIWITNNIERRLFTEHRVPENGHVWIHAPMPNDQNARAVETYYLNCGMQWWDGWWDHTAIYVYCYEITNTTRE